MSRKWQRRRKVSWKQYSGYAPPGRNYDWKKELRRMVPDGLIRFVSRDKPSWYDTCTTHSYKRRLRQLRRFYRQEGCYGKGLSRA